MKLFRFAFVLLLSLLAGLTLASSSISGTVTAAGTSPAVKVANVQVQLIGARRPRLTCATTYTDSSGRYSFTNLPAGKYRAVFSKDNFLPAYMSYYELANNVGVQLNASLVPYLQETEIERPRESQESFDIYNPNRFSVSYTWKSFRTKNTGTAVAAPGHNNLVVPKPIPERVMLFVGGIHDQPCGYTLLAPPLVLSKVSGTVLTGGIALPGATVTMTDLGGDIDDTAITDVNGAYTFFNTPNGVYTLTFTDDGYTTATQNIEVTGMPLVVPPVTLSALAQVNIRVIDASNLSVPAATVSISYADGNSVQGQTDGNGQVSFANQSANVTATISVTANDGSGRFITQTTTFSPGPNSLVLTLPTLHATIAVRVTDPRGNPVVSAHVNVTDSHNNQDTETTDSNGVANLGGFTANSSATIFVFTNDGLSNTVNTFLNAGANSATVVLPDPPANLDLTVLGPDGNPVPNASVTIDYSDGITPEANVTTNSIGMVRVLNQPLTQVRISVVSADTALAGTAFATIVPSENLVTMTLTRQTAFMLLTLNGSFGGVGLANTVVDIVDGSGNVYITGTTDSSGNLGVTHPPAIIQLYAVVHGPGSNVSTLPLQTMGVSQVSIQHITVPTATVNINVTDVNGPLSQTLVILNFSDGTASVGTTDVDGSVLFYNQPIGLDCQVFASAQNGEANFVDVGPLSFGLHFFPISVQ